MVFKGLFHAQKSPGIFSRDDKSNQICFFHLRVSYGFGLFLINFSNIIIVIEVGKEIGASSVDLIEKLTVVIILTIINATCL